ncbi:MAG TPA: hypothetical protein VHO70_01960 [Chitinispirillaceae bacterium]|nr:hypothetical protein [Chitinispirillaceae bacterium]
MNKLFLLILLHSFSLFICCSELSNPFDSESSNYISDSALIDKLHQYDSTFLTKSFFYDTIIHIDTVFHDSISITNTFHIDTVLYNDTNLISVTHIDTTTFFDTIFYNDSTFYIDTNTFYDTIFFQETLSFFDTTFYKDTFHFQDTFYHYDTVINYDTTVDTVRFFRTNPFLFLIDLADSSVFSIFNYGSSYNLAIKAAGVDPSIIRSYSILEPVETFLIPRVPPWSKTYNATSPVRYTLSITTDSGTFSNYYSVHCKPSSLLRGSAPVFDFFRISTFTGYDKTYHGFAPVCTLWTDSSFYTEYPDRIGYLYLDICYSLPGASQFLFYSSADGSYDINHCTPDGPGGNPELEYELEDLYPGTTIVTSVCRSVAPDTSLFSSWLTIFLVVLDGR